jgi:hypothetical protein
MDLIPKPLYPSVPSVPGVPALLRSGAKIIDDATFGAPDPSDEGDKSLGDAEQWGIFSFDGKPVAVADAVVSVQYTNQSTVLDHPVEKGAFASYNKVASPYTAKVRMAKGSSKDDRITFLKTIDDASNSTNLYSVATPEKTFENVNITGYDYTRETKSGAQCLDVTITLREIQQTAMAAFSKTQSVDCAATQSQGQVQASPVTPAQGSAVRSAAKTTNGKQGSITGSAKSQTCGIF